MSKTYYSMVSETLRPDTRGTLFRELPWAVEPGDRVLFSGPDFQALYTVQSKVTNGWHLKFTPRTLAEVRHEPLARAAR